MIYRVAVTDGQRSCVHAVELDAADEHEAAYRALSQVRAKLYVAEVAEGPETSERIMRPYKPRHAARPRTEPLGQQADGYRIRRTVHLRSPRREVIRTAIPVATLVTS
jgi:hypothetical protein